MIEGEGRVRIKARTTNSNMALDFIGTPFISSCLVLEWGPSEGQDKDILVYFYKFVKSDLADEVNRKEGADFFLVL